MGSMHHPRFYDPRVMETIKDTFQEVWTALDHDPSRERSHDGALKVAIIQRLMDLVEQGTTERDALKAKLLKNLPLA